MSDQNCKLPYRFKPFVFVKRGSKRISGRTVGPKPRSGHRIVCDDSNLYSFGGYNPIHPTGANTSDPHAVSPNDGPLFKELWKFNFASSTWSKLSCNDSFPNEVASNAAYLKGSTMMIYGGTGFPFGISCSNELYVFNLKDELKMKLVNTHGAMPPHQYGQALALDGHYLYTVGGTTGYDYSADIHRLDLRTGEWAEVYVCKGGPTWEPEGRYRHELGFDGVRLYVLGGGTASEVYGFQEIPAFNLQKGCWEQLVAHGDPDWGVPAPRRCHGSVQLPDGTIFVLGGYDGLCIFDDVWRLTLQTLQWTRIPQCRLPRAVYFHSTGVTSAGRIYSFGGIIEPHSNGQSRRTAEVHSAWACIPKLSEICWEALTHYNPNMSSMSKDTLINCGLPMEFVKRLDLSV